MNKKVGVIGTIATVNSGVYEKAISRGSLNRDIQKACPMFVPLVEGWWENDIAQELLGNTCSH